MFLTVKEMEILCIFYDGSLSATRDALKRVQANGTCPTGRESDLHRLINKLEGMQEGENVCLAL
ncbi:MAG: hypothetical protein FWC16_02245 [Defluviitaleaceae bacterium]|nr:hypothetical protein [Defluviitaleaceae bacterium]MCL2273720.1 hypothetical protein [Defluviitaleaceae bacterium]